MSAEVSELVEAVRDLRIRLIPVAGQPDAVGIGGSRQDFQSRLSRVALALEALDASGVASGDVPGEHVDPTMDAARLRVALDGVFRWMRSAGIDVMEPYAVVVAALGVDKEGERGGKGRGRGVSPKFSHPALGRRSGGSSWRQKRLEAAKKAEEERKAAAAKRAEADRHKTAPPDSAL